MLLQRHDFATERSVRPKTATLGIDTKTGVLRLSKAAAELIGIEEHSRLNFDQSLDDPAEWYLSLSADQEEGAEVRNNAGGGVLFNSSALAYKIAQSIDFEHRSGSMLIGKEPIESKGVRYWPLITVSMKHTGHRKPRAK